jgi:hypothetical protein
LDFAKINLLVVDFPQFMMPGSTMLHSAPAAILHSWHMLRYEVEKKNGSEKYQRM